MAWSIEDIKHSFGQKLVGNSQMKKLVCETLLLFPENIIDFVTKNCWFVSSFEDAWGFTMRGEELQNKYLIFLSDELFSQDEIQKHYTIAHEIGHVILGHKNAILEPQAKSETAKQEAEADQFARKYLKSW